MPMKIKRVCIVCDKTLESASGGDEDHNTHPPYGATVWTTTGNYGSTLYDPINNTDEWLECFICDECLEKKRNIIKKVSVVYPPKQRELYYESWDKQDWDNGY